MAIIFDLDQTLIDSKIAEPYRPSSWSTAYSLIPKFILYEGIRTVLDFIEINNISYAIVSSSPSTYCNNVCRHWGFRPKYIIGYHDAKRKPAPDPILLALRNLNAKPENSLSFGDRDIDILASNAANVSSIACLWHAENQTSLLAAKPSLVIEKPIEMLPIIKQKFKL